jgi:hypothetical protein
MSKQLFAVLGISILTAAFSAPLRSQGLGSPNVSPASGKPMGDSLYSSDKKKMRDHAAAAKMPEGSDSVAMRPAVTGSRAGDPGAGAADSARSGSADAKP